MARILLGVTGSVAAIRTPTLFRALSGEGHDVRVVSTAAGLYFFDPAELPGGVLTVDADEWPRAARGERYQRDDPVLHIELRKWADLLAVAPLDANTLAKFALGLCDNCLTCVWRAWDRTRPTLLAPAMNTLMWEHPATARHLRQLLEDFRPDYDRESSAAASIARAGPDQVVDVIHQTCPQLRVVGPISKRLACGDVGVGGMVEPAEVVAAVAGLLKFGS